MTDFGHIDSVPEHRAKAARVPDGTRVYAVGDIHGCADSLRALHSAILGDVERARCERLVAVYVGDYVDRGPDPRDVVDVLIEEPLPGFESVHLIGNHEAFLIGFLEDWGAAMSWLMNGGHATCISYGVDPLAAPDDTDRLAWLQRALIERIPSSHRTFFGNLRHSHVEGDYLFVHAGIRPGTAVDGQDPDDLLWIREPFLSSDEDFGKVVVHGHTPRDAPEVRANRIGIDTGACFGGRLTALVLEEDERRFLQI